MWANGAGHEKRMFGGGTGAGDPGAPAMEAQGRSVMGETGKGLIVPEREAGMRAVRKMGFQHDCTAYGLGHSWGGLGF